MIPYHRDPKERHRLVVLVGTYKLKRQPTIACRKFVLKAQCSGKLHAWHAYNLDPYNVGITAVICSVLHIVVSRVLFYIIPLPLFSIQKNIIKKIQITWSHSLKGQYSWSCCWSKENVMHWWRFMFPALECKNNPFPSQLRKHCQKSPSQNILCSLKLPCGPPQIHFPANPAGLLYVFFELYLSPGNRMLSPAAGLFNVILRYNCRSSVTGERRGETEDEGKGKSRLEGRAGRNTQWRCKSKTR